MPIGSIAQAIKLVSPGVSASSSLTYYLAPSMGKNRDSNYFP